MNRQTCRVCGKIRLIHSRDQERICSSCEDKFKGMLSDPAKILQPICGKCRTLIKNECPFDNDERKNVVKCNRFESKNAERNKRRWGKYGF